MDDKEDMSDWDEDQEDWYHSSDTENDMPDPNMDPKPLYQDRNMLPEPLTREHFLEGLLYTMTLQKDHQKSMLVMITHAKNKKFLYRQFFIRGSKRKTFHEGAQDKEIDYTEVWRLAPRRELLRHRDPRSARRGQTLRFTFIMRRL